MPGQAARRTASRRAARWRRRWRRCWPRSSRAARRGYGPPEPRGPYPGLSSFTEADAERFFGREAEVESLWGKLRRDTLLALIGPSGAGKTSFVRAGLVPARPSGWGAIVATPGGAPDAGAWRQALVGRPALGPGHDARASGLRRPRGGVSGGEEVAGEPPRGPSRRGPVRGAVHPEPAGGAGALRGAAGASGARGRRPRPAVAAGRLPHPLPRARRRWSRSSRT